MNKLKNAGWLLRQEDSVYSLEFKSDQIWLWATETVMVVYDLEAKLGYGAVIYANYVEPEGELRQLSVGKGDAYAYDHTKWLWLTEEQKKTMLKLIQQVVSTRSEPFPEPFKQIWNQARGYAKNLFIQHPGENKLYVPGRLRKKVEYPRQTSYPETNFPLSEKDPRWQTQGGAK